jgi:hypothetical protein
MNPMKQRLKTMLSVLFVAKTLAFGFKVKSQGQAEVRRSHQTSSPITK